MSCLFEPIHGRFPTNSICDSYPDCVGCSYSDPFKQPKQTNADRIRAMSDEELAKSIARIAMCVDCKIKNPTCTLPISNCEKSWLEWLKQEAET